LSQAFSRVTWRSIPWVAASASAASALLSLGAFGSPAQFALSRSGVAELELHRLWTGHAVHYGAAHLRGDLLAFLVWAALVETCSRRLLVVTLLAGAPLLSLAVLGCCPGVGEYRGLSGLDCTLVAELFVLRARQAPAAPLALFDRMLPRFAGKALPWAALALFLAKCALEAVSGRAVLAPDLGPGVELLPASHWLGVGVGVAAVAVFARGVKRSAPVSPYALDRRAEV
jgi:hypothetical protein